MLSRLNIYVNSQAPHASKNNITNQFLYTHGHGRIKFFQNPEGQETALATGHQDDNKNTYGANILCSLTFKVFQKHTFFA